MIIAKPGRADDRGTIRVLCETLQLSFGVKRDVKSFTYLFRNPLSQNKNQSNFQ